ncbi:ABC transporter substrate-binding protein [Enterococcus sp.]|uniref:ABC transporter substrate-binding protein n=1 Tax=Enterococcus sp. TaxID=35783 RepID=UPI002FC8FF23
MRRMSKLFAVATICGVLLSGCGKAKADSKKQEEIQVDVEMANFPIVKEKLSLTMMAPGTGLSEWKDMPTLQEYEEMTNMSFEYTTPPMSDFPTKLNLMFASGDLPDIIMGAGKKYLTPAMEVAYGSQGLLLPLEDLIPEYAPNFNKLMEEDPNIRKSITTPDGHIYSLPAIGRLPQSIWAKNPLWYKGEWLEKLNISNEELPKTTEEFYDLLVRFRDEDPNGNGKKDEIPLTDSKLNSVRPWLLAAFGMKELGIEEVDGVVRYTPITEEYKAFLEYTNKLFTEKLLDTEVYSQSDEQKKSKGQNNEIGVFPDYFAFFTTGSSESESLNDYMFHPLTSEQSPKAVVPGSPRINRGTFLITKNNPSPEASLRWADYFYSKEGYEFISQGPEGVLWEYAENDKGEQVKIYAENVNIAKKEETRGAITPNYGIPLPSADIPLVGPKENPNDPDSSEFQQFIEKETEEKVVPYAEVPYPLIFLTKEEQDKVNAIETDLKTYIEQMEAKFITGVEPLSNWDTYIDTIESMGVEAYIQVYQDAYDSWGKQ